MTCRHVWQPFADSVRIWQTCTKCGVEQHVTTHEAQLASMISYIFRDVPSGSSGVSGDQP